MLWLIRNICNGARCCHFLLFPFLAFSGLNGFGQAHPNFSLEYLDISKGLSNNYVSKIVTDNSGIKWFATEGGINSYDGNAFKLFRPNKKYKELKNENIETLYCAQDGRIWVGTKSGGLSVYDPVYDRFLCHNKTLNSKASAGIRITGIVEDESNNIWVSTWDNFLFKLSPEGEKAIAVFELENKIMDLTVDSYGNIWGVSSQYIYKYSSSENRLNKIPVLLGGAMTIVHDENNKRMLLGSGLGLFSFSTEDYSFHELQASINSDLSGINTVQMDSYGRIWVGSWTQGLLVSSLDGKRFDKVSLIPEYLHHSDFDTVLDIQIDHSGIIWVATGYGGVVKLLPNNDLSYFVNTYENNIGLPDNNIQSIVKDRLGHLWCGTWGGGIAYSNDSKRFVQLKEMVATKVSCFFELEEKMFVGTKEGLLIYETTNPRKGVVGHYMKGHKIKSICLDVDKRLWIGTQQNGLVMFDYENDLSFQNGTWFKSLDKKGLESERISVIIEDDKHRLWVGTYNGLYLFDKANFRFNRKDTAALDFPSVIVLSMLVQKNDALWLGVPGGLIYLKIDNENELKTIHSYGRKEGLVNDYITAVTEDHKNNIWLSNAAGIATLQRDKNLFVNINTQFSGSYSMNINSYFNDGETIYFGSSNGFFSFAPLQLKLSSKAPDIIITSLKVDNKEIEVGQEINGRILLEKNISYSDEIELTHRESVISLNYVAADLSNSDRINYHYRVRGLQEEWINNGNDKEISFVGLNAGDYVLEIKSTFDNINFGNVSTLNIAVAPPFWDSDIAWIIYFLVLILIIFAINKIAVNRTRLKANLEMAKMSKVKEQELNEAKLRFFTNISHELRTPLTLIISPLSEILSKTKLNGGIREKLSYIDKNANRLLSLINQLLDFRKADQGLLKLQVAPGNFVRFAKEIFLSFKGYAASEGVDFRFETSHDLIPLTYDRAKMEIVICNLLSNAFKFTSIKGKVVLSITKDDKYCVIIIEDNGKGISKKHQDKIFNRFFQIQDTETAKIMGSGIGLSLSQKIVQLHHGNIDVLSKVSKGTKFVISIPLGGDYYTKDEFLKGFTSTEDISLYVKEETELETVDTDTATDNKKTILVVDDNSDIRSYLESLFINEYKVITAENGLIAKDIAEKIIPDIIISDVMMPEMDGLELCKKLKSQVATSHIPIILLTARTSAVYETDGLDTGADDYIKKPFDANVVQSRVATQLENRKRIREHIRNKLRFETNPEIKSVNFEEKFIQHAFDIVHEHLDDRYFGIEVLSEKLFVSQSTLYRKIKSLTGFSISGFIRSVRLKKASEILLTQNHKLSTVAYMVGFNDYKYFKRSFVDQFGISPREYRMEKPKNSSQSSIKKLLD